MSSKWVELGRAVKTARHRAGLADTKDWTEAVGRTSRMLLGLERGESVGDGTLTRIEIALGWPVGWSHRILAGEVEGLPTQAESDQPDEAPQTGRIIDDAIIAFARKVEEDAKALAVMLEQRSRSRD